MNNKKFNKKLIIPEKSIILYDNDVKTIYGGISDENKQNLINGGITLGAIVVGTLTAKLIWNGAAYLIKKLKQNENFSNLKF